MWIYLLQKYWLYLVLLSVSLGFYFYQQILKAELSEVKSERDQYKQALEFQNASLMEQKAEYDIKLAQLPTEITKIKTRYEVIYADINSWEGDTNATDCDNARDFLNSFNY